VKRGDGEDLFCQILVSTKRWYRIISSVKYSTHRVTCNDSTSRAAASTRVFKYYSSSKLFVYFFTPWVLVTLYFRLPISICGCRFCSQSMNCLNLWNLGLRDFIFNLPAWKLIWIYTYVEGMLVQGPDPPGPRYADPQSLLHHWQLALKYFQY